MPRASLGAGEYRDDVQVERFDSVQLDKGEVARYWLPFPDPGADSDDVGWMEWVHTIRGPIFDEAGAPLMGQKETKNGFKDVYKTDFIGRRICLGSQEAFAENGGLDPERCPACAAVREMLAEGITDALDMKPQRRFAYPVISYEMASKKDDSARLRTPPNAKILVFSMSQWTYNKLDGLRGKIAELLEKPADEVDLHMVDIAAMCENTFKVPTSLWPVRRAWSQPTDLGKAVKSCVQALWGNLENRPTDAQLRAACGREPDLEWMAKDMEDAADRWRRARDWGKHPAGRGPVSGGASAQEQLDSLLASDAPPDDDPLAGHPGGLAEFAPAGQQARVAEAEDLFAAAEPAQAAVPDDADLVGQPAASPAPAASKGAVSAFAAILDGADV
jgi:hypothetical protein